MTKKKIISIIIVLLLIASGSWYGVHSYQKQKQEKQRQEQLKKEELTKEKDKIKKEIEENKNLTDAQKEELKKQVQNATKESVTTVTTTVKNVAKPQAKQNATNTQQKPQAQPTNNQNEPLKILGQVWKPRSPYERVFYTEAEAIAYFEKIGGDPKLFKYDIGYASMPSNKNGGTVWLVYCR